MMFYPNAEVLHQTLKGMFSIQHVIDIEQHLIAMKQKRARMISNDDPATEFGRFSFLFSCVG
eukprot:2124609-Ditylum_brightwellii.AAC.1